MKAHPEIAKIIGMDYVPDAPDKFYGNCPGCHKALVRFNSGAYISVFCKSSINHCPLNIAIKNHNSNGSILDSYCRIDIRVLYNNKYLDVSFDYDKNFISITEQYSDSLIKIKRGPVDFTDPAALLSKIKVWLTFS